jgi:hypothetical protein
LAHPASASANATPIQRIVILPLRPQAITVPNRHIP